MNSPDQGKAQLEFLCVGIGRGHPHYLDGIHEALIRRGGTSLVRRQSDVFEISRGLSRLGWKAVRLAYIHGSAPGLLSRLYDRVRRQSSHRDRSVLRALLGGAIRKQYLGSSLPLIVSHPLLVDILGGKPNLIYQHGELVAPDESLVAGASLVIVPTEAVASRFVGRGGYRQSEITVSGLCVEPSLVRQAELSWESRSERLQREQPLTGAFFSSGAEPADHVNLIVRAVHATVATGGRAVVFAKAGGHLARRIETASDSPDCNLTIIDRRSILAADLSPLVLVLHQNRREENALTAQFFPQFDFLVAPAHERTNWSLGLGLPMFVLTPHKGSFAPLNWQLLHEHGTALPIENVTEADRFGVMVSELHRSGQLLAMAQGGWGKYDIDGFARIADYLCRRFGAGAAPPDSLT